MTLKQVQSLVLWLRKERISYTTLSAGGVTLDGVVDGKAVDDAKPRKEEPRQTAFERYGADLLRQPTAKKSDSIPEEALDD